MIWFGLAKVRHVVVCVVSSKTNWLRVSFWGQLLVVQGFVMEGLFITFSGGHGI